MMEKNWWKNNYVDHRIYLLENYKNYNFTPSEFLTILTIDLMNQLNDTITIPKVAERMRMNALEVHEIIEKLSEDGWIILDITSKRMNISIDPVFMNKQVKKVSQSLFDLFEESFKRPLNSKEMETLGSWMQKYNEEYITRALREAIVYQKLSFPYINRILENWAIEGKTIEEIDNAD